MPNISWKFSKSGRKCRKQKILFRWLCNIGTLFQQQMARRKKKEVSDSNKFEMKIPSFWLMKLERKILWAFPFTFPAFVTVTRGLNYRMYAWMDNFKNDFFPWSCKSLHRIKLTAGLPPKIRFHPQSEIPHWVSIYRRRGDHMNLTLKDRYRRESEDNVNFTFLQK